MKTSQFLFVAAIKVCFVLFGVIPLISIILFGAMPTLPQIQSVMSWTEMDIVSGSVLLGSALFLCYLIVAKLFTTWKYKTRFSSVKAAA